MKRKYQKPIMNKIPFTIEIAFGKKCGMTNYPGSNCWPGAYEYK